jgi:hypothetical protein
MLTCLDQQRLTLRPVQAAKRLIQQRQSNIRAQHRSSEANPLSFEAPPDERDGNR